MLAKPVPDFSLAATGGTTCRLSALRSTQLVVYFDFRGIPRDSAASHERFKEKMRFPFALLSDPEEAVCGQFGVTKQKHHPQEVLNFAKAL